MFRKATERLDQPGPHSYQTHFPVVGIGASAAGLEALEAFLRPMPPDTGMAFVIVTHIGPGREGALVEVLARGTAMPVVTAADGTALERDRVYVLPSDATLLIEDNHIRLRGFSDQRERTPIDVFLASLAENSREDAVAVILAGAGSDGTLGVKAIKERGGLTLAQARQDGAPQHDGMPASAISSGLIDLVLPVEEMAAKLVSYVASFERLEPQAAGWGRSKDERTERARLQICDHMLRQVRHDFRGYKDNTFLRRVQRRMQVLQLDDIARYAERLGHDHDEVTALFRDLLIGVTSFFRDEAVFELLREKVIPALFEKRAAQDTIRVWVPGCSTGEEVYSLAMLFVEHAAGLRAPPRVQVFGTDIDDAGLAVARAGRYPESMLEGVSPQRRQRSFVRDGASFVISKRIRDLCMFSSHSVIRDPPFSRIDLISCRNLLIYFGTDLQGQVLPVFHYALRPNAYLVLGTAENATQFGNLFTPIDKGRRVFQRHSDIAAGRARVPPTMLQPGSGAALAQVANLRWSPPWRNVRAAVESRVLERFAPAHVAVNPAGDIVHYSARTGRYLEPASGTPSQQLLATARRGLRLDLRTALHEAATTRRPVTRNRVMLDIDDGTQPVTLTVEPLRDPAAAADAAPHMLVVFADEGAPFVPDPPPAGSPERAADAASIERLEHELHETRDRLQLVIEEYETALEELKSANEELVSVNEEIQSTNEELETSKEEIQSINEELHTVNAELMIEVAEHDRANTDLRNLFESSQVATVFLDRHLRIRSFTPAVTAIFNLLPADRGRPLTDFATNLDGVDLKREIAEVLETSMPREHSITRDGAPPHYLMRLLPYRTSEGAIDGVLVLFVDVTSLVAAEEQQRTLVVELNHRVRNMLQVVAGVSAQTMKRAGSLEEFSDSFLGRLYAMGRSYELLSRERWSEVGLGELLLKILQPFEGGPQRIAVTGPRVLAKPTAALSLGMVLHELATNAMKYGALSVPDGQVRVTLSVVEASQPDTKPGEALPELQIEWRESGGPPVTPPQRRGLGTDLIERQFRYELKGRTTLDFAPSGLLATLRMPLDPKLLTIPHANGGTP